MFSDTTWSLLASRLEDLPHAILIHGPRGIGKLELATRFVQLLLCESRQGTAPCGRCDACRWFRDGNHPDYRLVQSEALSEEGAGEGEEGSEPAEATSSRKARPSLEIKVGQIRALADFLHVGSHRGARRIALVHPAEAMNANAANSLLKALEEPPPGAVFVLVSHAPARLLPTVRSRCFKVGVPRPTAGAALRWMESRGLQGGERWLAFAGGAPVLAADLASGEQARELSQLIETLESGGRPGAVNTRESLEQLAEVMQKMAFDAALAGMTGAQKYASWRAKTPSGDPAAWLRFARQMGRNRALARRPLNPQLFADDLLQQFSALRK